MPKSYKLKLILGGAKGSGKSSIIHGGYKKNTTLGVSFKTIECMLNQGDYYKFLVWDLKEKPRFKEMYPGYCRGSCGGLICFNISNYGSFRAINDWIDIIKENAGNVPIILVGIKKDKKPQEVFENEINNIIKQKNLSGIFYYSVYDENIKEIRIDIFKKIIKIIHPKQKLNNFSILSPFDDINFVNFKNNFSHCPICKKENHFEVLKNFYYSRDTSSILLKNQLLDLIDNFEYWYNIYGNQVNFGIPCCDCYRIFFKNKN